MPGQVMPAVSPWITVRTARVPVSYAFTCKPVRGVSALDRRDKQSELSYFSCKDLRYEARHLRNRFSSGMTTVLT